MKNKQHMIELQVYKYVKYLNGLDDFQLSLLNQNDVFTLLEYANKKFKSVKKRKK